MKVIELFAGCGGSSLGWTRAGCSVLAAVEWDEHAAECYSLNHPGTVLLRRDVTTLSGSELLDITGLKVGELDVLSGSPPCQGFSTLGSRVSTDPRNSLVFEHLRLVEELQPRHVTIENVAGMLTGDMLPIAQAAQRRLIELGYRVVVGVLDAQYFGVAQRRKRVFFIASRVQEPRLPAPQNRRPIPCGDALRGIEPDEVLVPTSALGRLFCKSLQPGEDGGELMERLGRKRCHWGTWMLNPKTVAPTLTKSVQGDYGPVLHWQRRRLSVREALVLSGFPPDYVLPGEYRDRWARIGNTVVPPVMEAVARSLMAGGS